MQNMSMIYPVRCLMFVFADPVRHCDHFVLELGAGCFAFLWYLASALSVIDCSLFL